MTRLTYNVVRRPGGWAVEHDAESLCCYRTQVQAVAQARLLGRDRWRDAGQPSCVQVQSITGLHRTEVTFGHDHHPG